MPRPCLGTLRLLALLLPVSALAGCTGSGSPERTIAGLGDGVHDAFAGHANARTETIRLAATGVIGVDVESFAGDVEIVGAPQASEIVVTISRESTHGFLRQGEGKDSLANVHATAEIMPGNLGPLLQVRASTSDAEAHYQRAHVRIEAADIEGVRVRTARGRVDVRNTTGTIDVETSGGDVRVLSRRPLTSAVTILTSEGSIDYRVNGLSTGRFDVETVGGAVRVRCTDGRWSVGLAPTLRPGVLTARLNDGENPVVLRTTEDDIRIAVVPDPTAVGAIIVSP